MLASFVSWCVLRREGEEEWVNWGGGGEGGEGMRDLQQ